jgi:flagellar biosynthesis protein FlhF
MRLETFRGPELRIVTRQIRQVLGEDAMIIRTRVVRGERGDEVEVIAARPQDIEALKQSLDGGRAAATRARDRKKVGPYVVALVGPAGAGKTTSLMKVALSPQGVAHRKVGLLTLDTYRVGALEEIQTYAEIADLPVEVAYAPADARAAVARLRGRDVILVDTPGRGFGGTHGEMTRWVETLEALEPDEIHLVLPAGLRLDVARAMRRAVPGVSPTHVLLSKLDESGVDASLVELTEALALPARWVADSPDIPSGLAPAGARILAALGIAGGAEGTPGARRAG